MKNEEQDDIWAVGGLEALSNYNWGIEWVPGDGWEGEQGGRSIGENMRREIPKILAERLNYIWRFCDGFGKKTIQNQKIY